MKTKFADYAAAYATRHITDADARKAALLVVKAAIVAETKASDDRQTAAVFARFYARTAKA